MSDETTPTPEPPASSAPDAAAHAAAHAASPVGGAPEAPRPPAGGTPPGASPGPSSDPSPGSPPGGPVPPVPPSSGWHAPPPGGADPDGRPWPAPPSPPRRGRLLAAVVAVAALLASAVGGGLLALALDDDDDTTPATTSFDAEPSSDDSDAPAADEPLSQAAAEVLPSVVSIAVDAGPLSGGGSGIVISSDGQILTNNHVAAPAAESGNLEVTFSDGTTAEAEIVGRDPATDLAVIQAQDVDGLVPATLGSSSELNVGDTVLAIGSPLGLEGSVSSGIVSALGRSITLQGEGSPFGGGGPGGAAAIDAIQTDAAINPGNSGGALANTDGEVVGINTAIAALAGGATTQGGNIGLGFAIPIDTARDIARQLVEEGSVTHAYMGVSIVDADRGAMVAEVEPGQPADEAGLREGDVITRVDDTDIDDSAGLMAAVRANSPGDTVAVTYTRDGDEHTAEVTLGELPTG
jgi:putative serine protease PepD